MSAVRWFWLLQVVVILLAPPSAYAWAHRKEPERALKGAASLLALVYALFFGTFAVGEVFADPGGWTAVAGTAAWLAPLAGLSVLAWRRPDWAVAPLGVLLLALVGVYAWSVFAPQAWATFEDANGPVRALVAFALALPLAVLGRTRPRVAGVMLLALAVLPVLFVVVGVARGLGAHGWPIALVTAPAAVVGVLYLAADAAPAAGRRHPDWPGPTDRVGRGSPQPQA